MGIIRFLGGMLTGIAVIVVAVLGISALTRFLPPGNPTSLGGVRESPIPAVTGEASQQVPQPILRESLSLGPPPNPKGQTPAHPAPESPVAQENMSNLAESLSVVEDRPLMAIVLFDDSASPDTSVLNGFPFPLTIAINPISDSATSRSTLYRRAGFEILATVDLPVLTDIVAAKDYTVGWLDRVPGAVALMERPQGRVRTEAELSEEVFELLREIDVGLITRSRGLQFVQEQAEYHGIPFGRVFRDIDGVGQDDRVMRRFLNQAVYRARLVGPVIVLGRVRVRTLNTIAAWGRSEGGNRVTLAPVSEVLRELAQDST